MDLTKHFQTEDFNCTLEPDHLKRICNNILEPIQLRFGKIIIHGGCTATLFFKVEGFDNQIIYDYIRQILIHSFVACDAHWICVACEGDV